MNIKTNTISLARLAIISLMIMIAAISVSQAQVKDWRTDDHLAPEVREFLKGLNTGGPGLETLTPIQAREV